jgi:hypothetical protein
MSVESPLFIGLFHKITNCLGKTKVENLQFNKKKYILIACTMVLVLAFDEYLMQIMDWYQFYKKHIDLSCTGRVHMFGIDQ